MADDQQGTPAIQQSPAQGAMAEWVERLYKAASRTRYAEEREWATAGYFDQLKQWLEEDPQAGNKLRPMSKKRDSKWPMPVTNLFSKTIALNANGLGASLPRMAALSDDYDMKNRRAAEAAENVIDAANRESGMEVLNPKLARQTVLWGMGCVYDTIAFDHSTVEVAQVDDQQPQPGMEPQQPEDVEPQTLQAMGVQTVPTARLKSYLLTPFEYYLPRDAQDANLAPWKMIRWRRPLGECKEMYPDYADKLKKDTDDTSLAFYYLNTLRSLSYQNQAANEAEGEFCTLTIIWTDWTSIPEDVQDKISAEWESQPSDIYADAGFSKLQAAIEYGLFAVTWNRCVVQWAENPWSGKSPLTFFPWDADSGSVYPKSLSSDLIPLVKSLNRVDSLMLRAVMSTGTGKWLHPNTQPITQYTGDPVEVVSYDPIGEGKVKPEFIQPTPYGPALIALRKQIVDDINAIGMNNSVAEGDMPEGAGGMAFRAYAYLGSKAEESKKTHRFLWEASHELRAKLLVEMAKKVWTEPRKVYTAGFNNRYGAQQLEAADLDGGYEIDVIQDSSKPKTLTEKLQAVQMAQQGGYVDPQDPSTKEYVLSALGLQELDEADSMQWDKAVRDLEKVKNGEQPMFSPYEKWDISLRLFARYTLTEEFEDLPENIRNGILMVTQWLSEMTSVGQTGMPPGATPPMPAPGPGGPGGQPAGHVLHQVPGSQVSAPQVESAAIKEAADVVPNSPPTA